MPAGITQTSSSNHADVPRVEIVRSPSHTEGSSANPSPSKTTIKRQGQTPGSARSGSSASTDEAPTSEPKRRGRPPGSKNLMSRTASSPGSSGNFSVPARPRGIDTTPARPSGLRNTITPSDGIAVVIVTPRTTNERKRKGSSREPDRSLKAAPDQTMRSSPAYKVYLCEWKGCKAELHNLETLRKHVRKLHRMRPNVDGIPCLWSNCEKTRRIYDKQTGSKKEVHYPHTFSTSTLWDAHMDKKHLEPTAWALGDGPSVHPSGKSPSQPPSLPSPSQSSSLFSHSQPVSQIPQSKLSPLQMPKHRTTSATAPAASSLPSPEQAAHLTRYTCPPKPAPRAHTITSTATGRSGRELRRCWRLARQGLRRWGRGLIGEVVRW